MGLEVAVAQLDCDGSPLMAVFPQSGSKLATEHVEPPLKFRQ
jgi:hypothetical protein